MLYDCDFGDSGALDRCGYTDITSTAVLPGNTQDSNDFIWNLNGGGDDGYLYLYGYDYGNADVLVG